MHTDANIHAGATLSIIYYYKTYSYNNKSVVALVCDEFELGCERRSRQKEDDLRRKRRTKNFASTKLEVWTNCLK